MILEPGLEGVQDHVHFLPLRDERRAHLMADGVESEERAPAGDLLVRLPPRVIGAFDGREVSDTQVGHVDPLCFVAVDLIQGTGRAALVRHMGEDRESGSGMYLADGADHLALVVMHLRKRAADFAQRSPPFVAGLCDQVRRNLLLGQLDDLLRIPWLQEVAATQHDVHTRPGGHRREVRELLFGAWPDRGIYDAAHTVEGCHPQLLDQEVDHLLVGGSRGRRRVGRPGLRWRAAEIEGQMLVKQRRPRAELRRVDVGQHGPHDGAVREGDGGTRRSRRLFRHQLRLRTRPTAGREAEPRPGRAGAE